MTRGVKSKYFSCYWATLFLTALAYPEKADKIKDKEQIAHFKIYYNSLKYIIPCCFCRDFIRDHLEKEFPLDFSGRKQLIYSVYLWKDAVNKKLIGQGCKKTKSSPPFEVILKRLEKKYATCDKKVGKCV